jgi:hypothetical protein
MPLQACNNPLLAWASIKHSPTELCCRSSATAAEGIPDGPPKAQVRWHCGDWRHAMHCALAAEDRGMQSFHSTSIGERCATSRVVHGCHIPAAQMHAWPSRQCCHQWQCRPSRRLAVPPLRAVSIDRRKHLELAWQQAERLAAHDAEQAAARAGAIISVRCALWSLPQLAGRNRFAFKMNSQCCAHAGTLDN